MKTFLFILALVVLTPTAHAGPVSGKSVRLQFSTQSTVGTSVWLPLVTSTVKGLKGVSIFSSANFPIEVGVAFATEASNAEVAQMIVPAPLTAVGAPGAIFYPLSVGYGTRVSIRSKGSVATEIINSGELDMSLWYN